MCFLTRRGAGITGNKTHFLKEKKMWAKGTFSFPEENDRRGLAPYGEGLGNIYTFLRGVWEHRWMFLVFAIFHLDYIPDLWAKRLFFEKTRVFLKGTLKVTMSAILTSFFMFWLNSSSPMGVGEMVCGTFLKHLGRPKLLWRNFCSWTSRPVINPGFMVILVLLKGMLRLLPLIDRVNNFNFWLA